ncbi:MAG TPA: carboxypeptidase-like regulatory domain-containing protein [Blastocatellia bacterium]|nr:carboxypeptidase-like regulatory domain-containing protein [Blastocatellia bacterium]
MRTLAAFIFTFFLVASALFAQSQPNGTITGRVEREDGKPFGGVTVKATNRSNQEEKEVTSTEDGRFSLSLPPGDYAVTFTMNGYSTLSLQKTVTVAAGKSSEIKAVRMSKEISVSKIRGKVYSEDGFSLAGATIILERTDEGKKLKLTRQANAAGEFAFQLPGEPGHYKLTASLKGFKSDTKDLDVDSGEIRTVAFKLSK